MIHGCLMLPAIFDHPGWILFIAAGIASLTAWLIFRVMTDQGKLRRLDSQIIASALELVLYRHDVAIQVKALAGMLNGIGKSALTILPGAIIAAIPFLLILMLLDTYFNGRPLKPGESAIVKAYLAPNISVVDQDVALKGSGNIAIETPALRVPEANEIDWRIRIKENSPTPAWLELGVHGKSIRHRISVIPDHAMVSFRDAGDWIRGKFSPDDATIKGMAITYPPREFRLAGMQVEWFPVFLLVAIGFSALFKLLR